MRSEHDFEVVFRELFRWWNASPRARAMLIGRIVGRSGWVGLFSDLLGGRVLTMSMMDVLPTILS